jgi:hypothetical protein
MFFCVKAFFAAKAFSAAIYFCNSDGLVKLNQGSSVRTVFIFVISSSIKDFR